MGLLGEIVKTTQALQYHAKSTEIAGKNLSHVNDENYARQRIVARDGAMHKGSGYLGTSALEMGGLDHARSELLDRRVVSEVGETSSLEARKEILDLLQAALGERVTRQGVNVGLDDQSESDLAPGSLTRSLNDFFNAFQELSASPDEPTIKQELYHKTQTLGKRFNEAGEKFESIEADLTATVKQAVVQINTILEQLHEVNKQIRRFELQGKGKATTYHDRRQQLLEDLSKHMDFKVEDDFDPTTGQASGLLNLFSTTTKGEKVKLLDPNGSKTLTTNWGQEFAVSAPANSSGTLAQVRAKIGVDGKLGRVEVLDGGSKYSDADGPILVALAPPARTEPVKPNQAQDNAVAGLAEAGIVAEAALQAGQPVDQGPDLGAQTGTAGIAGAGVVGAQDTATAPTGPVVAPFPLEKGEVINYQGSYYQSLASTAKGDNLSDETKFLRIDTIPNGQVREYSWNLSDLETFSKGEQFYHNGKLYQTTGGISPVVAEKGVSNESGALVSSQGYAKGDVFQYGGTYYQALESFETGQSLPQGETIGNQSNGFVSLGTQLPSASMDSNQLLAINPSTDQAVAKGQYLLSNNKYFVALEDFSTGGSPTKAFSLTSDARVEEVMTFVDSTVKSTDKVRTSQGAKQGDVIYDSSSNAHFLVKTSFLIETPAKAKTFDPTSTQWSGYVQKITPQLVSGNNLEILRRADKSAFDPKSGKAVELNLGLAEAIVEKGEIVGFNIINQGNGYPPSDALFADGVELALKSGSVHGYQGIRMDEMETFRQQLNSLSTDFVTQVNQIYNPDDEPGGYIFGFDAFLGRPTQGANEVMEEEYGLMGTEGEGEFILYRDEVDMTVPYPEKDTFMVTYAAPIFPEELAGTVPFVRGSLDGEMMLNNPDFVKIYGSARRMKHVTMEADLEYIGPDGSPGTNDDGRMVMLGYEKIPFRMEAGDKSFVFGDNFSFDAVPANAWNVAKSMRVDQDFTFDTIKVSSDTSDGANDIALAIAEKGNGDFTEKVSTLNTSIGNSLADVGDNLDHQNAVERLLIDERQAVSSVSMDEEVSDLMRFQRSFQASSRVLKTLDSMLELVVMGLLR
jgi:flagellar hook-associated protein FlgK